MPTTNGKQGTYVFGEFTLDVDRAALLKDGREIPVRPKSFDVLRYLVENHGRVVSKEELLAAVWGDVVVSDGSIVQCMIDLRKALGDDERSAVRTVPRRGYMFCLPVTERSPDANGAPGTGTTMGYGKLVPAGAAVLLAIVIAAAWLATRPAGDTAAADSIAVVPFIDSGAPPDDAYFSEGVAHEILDLLAGIPDLRVTARSSSFSYQGRRVDSRTIAEELDVAYVLEGSIRRDGDEIRVSVHLVDAATNMNVWSRTYDRKLGDVLEVQREIAKAVANSLSIELTDTGTHADPDIEAYERYLQGRFFLNRRSPGDIERAASYFRRAVDIEPGYTRAWAAAAGAYYLMTVSGDFSPAIGWEKMREAFERALAIDPSVAEAHLRAAQYYYHFGDARAGSDHFEEARRLDPDNLLVLSMRAGTLVHRGRLEEAAELHRRAVTLDPLSFVNRANFSRYLASIGRYEEALQEHARALELNSASASELKSDRALLLILLGRHAEALESIRRWRDGPLKDHAAALAYGALGLTGESNEAFERLISHAREDLRPLESSDSFRPGAGFLVAEVLSQRGDLDAAFGWLTRELELIREEYQSSAFYWRIQLQLSPFLRPLRDDSRWARLAGTDRSGQDDEPR